MLITKDEGEEGEERRDIEFSWHVVGYTNDFIYLKIDYENPWDISDSPGLDTLSVTFWGTNFFKSKENKDVRFGTTLYWPIIRQMDGE